MRKWWAVKPQGAHYVGAVGWSCDEQHPVNLYKYDQWQCRSFAPSSFLLDFTVQLIPQQPLDNGEASSFEGLPQDNQFRFHDKFWYTNLYENHSRLYNSVRWYRRLYPGHTCTLPSVIAQQPSPDWPVMERKLAASKTDIISIRGSVGRSLQT